MKKLLVILSLMLVSIKAAGNCYSDPDTLVVNCDCDASCDDCGYGFDPTGPNDCLGCADESHILFGKAYMTGGFCAEPDEESDCQTEEGWGVPGCFCEYPCNTCVHWGGSTRETDCLDCLDGLHLTEMWSDNSGFCSSSLMEPYHQCDAALEADT